MAREDLLAQLMISLTEKEGPPPPDENTLIEKIIAPNDSASLSDDAPTFTLYPVANMKWGGDVVNMYISPGWKWGQVQEVMWGGKVGNTYFSPGWKYGGNSVGITYISPDWKWGQGQYK